MRAIGLLLLLAAPVLADDAALRKELTEAREGAFTIGGRARMMRAVELVREKGGAAALEPTAMFIRDTFVWNARTQKSLMEIKSEGATIFRRIEETKRELDQLQQRRRAGATGLEVDIRRRTERLKKDRADFDRIVGETRVIGQEFDAMLALRERAARACEAILVRIDAAQLAPAVAALRRIFAIDDATSSLMLVRLLRQSKRAEVSTTLLEMHAHPKLPPAAKVEAACAIASIGVPADMRVLLARLDAEPAQVRTRVLHALSRTARRKLASIDEAKTWAKSLS
ncbi:MAG: hypothetical protein AAGD14_05270 [Planctomycetota bacterium]